MAAIASDKTIHDAMYEQLKQNTSDEYSRLKLQHELLARAMGNELIRAPLPASPAILDSACSDGLWMLEVSKTVINAVFRGTDIEPHHFSQIKNLPSNITFEKQSIFDPWPTSYHSAYDLVHQKYCLAMCQPAVAAECVKRLLDNVKPGGWIQLVEPDLAVYQTGEGHAGFTMLVDFVTKAYSMGKLNPNPGTYLRSWIEEAGAVDVREEVLSYCIGASEPDQEMAVKGELTIMAMIDMYEMIATKMPNYFYTKEDFAKLKQALQHELRTTGNVWKFHVVWGRRT